jgi:hypothetical protein
VTDLVFWWTGWAVWAMIGLVVALIALLAAIGAVFRVYRGVLRWNRTWSLCYVDPSWIASFREAAGSVDMTQEELDKLLRLQAGLKARLGRQATAPLRQLECSWWYELTNGDFGQIVRYSPGSHSPTSAGYEMRTVRDELIEIRADGRLRHNPAIQVLKEADRDHCEEQRRLYFVQLADWAASTKPIKPLERT